MSSRRNSGKAPQTRDSSSSSMLLDEMDVRRTSHRSSSSASSSSAPLPSSARSPASSIASNTFSDRTMQSGSTLPAEECIFSLIENRSNEVGCLLLNLETSHVLLFQYSDLSNYPKTRELILRFRPKEIIMPHTTSETKLFQLLVQDPLFRFAEISTVLRKFYSDTQGLETVRALVSSAYHTTEMMIQDKYLCLAAANAGLKYAEQVGGYNFAPKSLQIRFQVDKGVSIDSISASNLELVCNSRTGDRKGTLLSILDETLTPMGARFLKGQVLQPSNDIGEINARLDSVSEILDKEEVYQSLRLILPKVPDLDKMLSRFSQISKAQNEKTAITTVSDVLHLKHSLLCVSAVSEALGECGSKILDSCYASLTNQPLKDLVTEIEEMIDESAVASKNAAQMQKAIANAIKPGVNGLLDAARKTYSETLDDVHQHRLKMSEGLGVDVKVTHSSKRGHYLYTDISHAPRLANPDNCPTPLLQKVTSGKRMTFSTAEIQVYNHRIREAVAEVALMTQRSLRKLLEDIRAVIGHLQVASQAISLLDLLVSFATLASSSVGYQRPDLTEDGPIAIKDGRHPYLDRQMGFGFVPNSTFISPAANLHVINGPNMAGKSTYLKQIAHLAIMAHIGSFVPASWSSFRMLDNICTRLGTDDSMENNASTFMQEMREVAYILQHIGPKSLVLVDELGRGTSNLEGVSIAWAVCEQLLANKCFTFFVTHYVQLRDLEQLYPNVRCFHLKVGSSDDGSLRYEYSLSQGGTGSKHYGLQVARQAGMPEALMADAHRIVKLLEQRAKERPIIAADALEREKHRIATNIVTAMSSSSLNGQGLKSYLQIQKNRFLQISAAATAAQTQPQQHHQEQSGQATVVEEGDVPE